MIGMIPAWAAPAIAMIDRQDNLGFVAPDRFRQITTQFQVVHDQAIAMVEKFHLVYAHYRTACTLLISASWTNFGWIHRGDAGFTLGHK
jgi:hypothetical protein